MATKAEELRKLAQTIKNETQIGGNTAKRVGNAFLGVANALDGSQAMQEIEKAVAKVQQMVDNLPVTQQTGNSTTSVMSQKAVTDAIAETGRKLLNFTNDVATTRLLVSAAERKAGIQITYRLPEGKWVNEMYVSSTTTDAEWKKDENWQSIGKDSDVFLQNPALVKGISEYLTNFNGTLTTTVDGFGHFVFDGDIRCNVGFALSDIMEDGKSYRIKAVFSVSGTSTDLLHIAMLRYVYGNYSTGKEIKKIQISDGDIIFDDIIPSVGDKKCFCFHMSENGSAILLKDFSVEKVLDSMDYSSETNTHINKIDSDVRLVDKKYDAESVNWITRHVDSSKDYDAYPTFWISDTKWALNNSGYSTCIYVGNTDRVKIKNLHVSEAMTYHLLKSFTGASSDNAPDLYDGIAYTIKALEEKEISIPKIVTYICIKFRNRYDRPYIDFDFSWRSMPIKNIVYGINENSKVKKIFNLNDKLIDGSGCYSGGRMGGLGTGFLSRDDYDSFDCNLVFQSNQGVTFWDKNKNYLAFHQLSNSNGELIHEVVPFIEGAQYAIISCKGRAKGDYLYGIKYNTFTQQQMFDKVDSLSTQQQNSGYIYLASNYGVSVDSTDNSAALTSLIEKVGQAGGGIIELPKGTFAFKKSVTFKSNVGLRGQGIGNTILDMQDGPKDYALFVGDFVNNIFVSDLEIQSPNTASTGKHLFMRYIQDSYFSHIKSVGSRPTAIGIDFLNNVTITDNIIINAGRGGNIFGHACIGIGTGYEKWDNEDFIIANNVCIGGGMRGIFVEDQNRFDIANKGKMKAGYGQVIANNIVRNCNRGIMVEAGKYVNVTGNTIYNCNIGCGCKIYADNCLFTGNVLVGNKIGFNIDELTSVSSNCISFIGNSIDGGATAAIYIDPNALLNDLFIKGNVFKGASTGVQIISGLKRLVLQGNNDFSTAHSFVLAGEFVDSVLKDNTYLVAPESTATYSGNQSFVEQFK